MIKDIGRAGQDWFQYSCTLSGLEYQPPIQDLNGWDYLIEHPYDENLGSSVGRLNSFFQIKTSDPKYPKPRLKLSALLKLVESDLPCFIVHFNMDPSDKVPRRAIIYHVGDEIISAAIARARLEISKGSAGKKLNEVNVTLNHEWGMELPTYFDFDGYVRATLLILADIGSSPSEINANYMAWKSNWRGSCRAMSDRDQYEIFHHDGTSEIFDYKDFETVLIAFRDCSYFVTRPVRFGHTFESEEFISQGPFRMLREPDFVSDITITSGRFRLRETNVGMHNLRDHYGDGSGHAVGHLGPCFTIYCSNQHRCIELLTAQSDRIPLTRLRLHVYFALNAGPTATIELGDFFLPHPTDFKDVPIDVGGVDKKYLNMLLAYVDLIILAHVHLTGTDQRDFSMKTLLESFEEYRSAFAAATSTEIAVVDQRRDYKVGDEIRRIFKFEIDGYKFAIVYLSTILELSFNEDDLVSTIVTTSPTVSMEGVLDFREVFSSAAPFPMCVGTDADETALVASEYADEGPKAYPDFGFVAPWPTHLDSEVSSIETE